MINALRKERNVKIENISVEKSLYMLAKGCLYISSIIWVDYIWLQVMEDTIHSFQGSGRMRPFSMDTSPSMSASVILFSKTFLYTFLYIIDYLTNMDTSSPSMSASAILSSKTVLIFIIDYLNILGSTSLSVLKTFLYIIDYLTTIDISPSMSASFILSSKTFLIYIIDSLNVQMNISTIHVNHPVQWTVSILQKLFL